MTQFMRCCQTLMELVKRRKRLTEVEVNNDKHVPPMKQSGLTQCVWQVQCFMWQLVEVMDYLHKSNVIHRDLKLGNLFLHGNMLIKLGAYLTHPAHPTCQLLTVPLWVNTGDFGLAAKLEHPEERKK